MHKQQFRYYKTINNNAIVAWNDKRHEVVLLGKGIGIHCMRNINSIVDDSLIERVFVAQNNTFYLESLLSKIPYRYYELVENIIKQASRQLNHDFKDLLYIPLLDHIYFAQKMISEGQRSANPLLSEIKMFHRKEYLAASVAVDMINDCLQTNFDENETAYIAFHLINAMSNLSQTQNRKLILMLNQTIQYISSIQTIELDEHSYYYGRLLSHIKYFLMRKLEKEPVEEKGVMNQEMLKSLHKMHQLEWEQARLIQQFMKKEFAFTVSEQELAYLTMHIVPMIKKEESL